MNRSNCIVNISPSLNNAGGPRGPCVDYWEHCEFHKEQGVCEDTNNKYNCQKTCRVCCDKGMPDLYF